MRMENSKNKFEKGDVVRIRDWDDMEEEFGLTSDGDINCGLCFLAEMKPLCGKEITVKYSSIDDLGRVANIKIGGIFYYITGEMVKHINLEKLNESNELIEFLGEFCN